jgi:hypothetical protein
MLWYVNGSLIQYQDCVESYRGEKSWRGKKLPTWCGGVERPMNKNRIDLKSDLYKIGEMFRISIDWNERSIMSLSSPYFLPTDRRLLTFCTFFF